MKRIVVFAAAAFCAVTMAACGSDKKTESAEDVKEQVKETGEALQDAGAAAGEDLKEGAEKWKEKMND